MRRLVENAGGMEILAVIEQDEDGKFAALCPNYSGCWSQGDTHAEALTNIADAIEGYLESIRKSGDPIPARTA